MKFGLFFDLFLMNSKETLIHIEDSEAIYSVTLVAYFSHCNYEVLYSRIVEKIYIKDNILHIVLEDK